MSTYLRLLGLAFWMSPLQRWCTVLGLGVGIVAGNLLLAPTSFGLDLMMWGLSATLLLPMLLGGALWRAVAAPRAISLAPYGRARLLLAAAGVALTVAVLCMGSMFLFYMGLAVPYRMGSASARELFVTSFAAATLWGIASFIASRSPLAMLLALGTVIASVFVLGEMGIDSVLVLWRQPWGIALPFALWAIFGIWYLCARRIRPPGWLLPGGQSIFAAVATTDTTVTGLSQRAAMERLLLGGASVPRILAQWLLAGGLLLGILLPLARAGEREALSVAHVVFASLILCPAIVAAQSAAVVRRARVLWLPTGFTRVQLFAFTERTLLKFATGMALVFAAFLLVLWFTQPWRPTLTLLQALLVILLPSLLLATHTLLRPKGADVYWRWPLVILLCWFVARTPLTSSDPVGLFDSRGWLWFVLAGVATLSFHKMARHRWLAADLPRAATSP